MLGEALKQLRQSNFITRKEIAENLNVKEIDIYNWESNITEPDAKQFCDFISFASNKGMYEFEFLKKLGVEHETACERAEDIIKSRNIPDETFFKKMNLGNIIERLEWDKKDSFWYNLPKLAEILEVRMEYLLTGKGEIDRIVLE